MNWELIIAAVGNVFVAGVAYGAIRSKVTGLHERLNYADKQREHLSRRVDSIFSMLTNRR